MWISAIFGSSTAFVEAPWRIYTKKKIRSTADITAVRLYYIHSYAERVREKEIETLRRCRFVCAVRSDLLGWDQPGHQQFGGIGI